MKSFKFRYSTLVWVLLLAVTLISTGGLVLNILNILKYAKLNNPKIYTFIIIGLIDLMLLVFVLSVILNGKYVIKKDKDGNGFLYVYIGFLRFKNPVSNIIEIAHFKKSDKLVVYYKDEKYSVIVISNTEFDEFIDKLREINPQIFYDVRFDGEDTPQ